MGNPVTYFWIAFGFSVLTILMFAFRNLQADSTPEEAKRRDRVPVVCCYACIPLVVVTGVWAGLHSGKDEVSGWIPDHVLLGVEFTNNEEEGPSPAVFDSFQTFEGTRRFQKVTMGDLEQRTVRFGRNGFVSTLSTSTKYFDPGTQFGISTKRYWIMEMEKLTKDLTAIEVNSLTPVSHPILRSFGQAAEVRGFRPDGTSASCVFARVGLSGARLPTDPDETPKKDKEFKTILRVFIRDQGETVESVLRRIRSVKLESGISGAQS